jgi:hypothetical protein
MSTEQNSEPQKRPKMIPYRHLVTVLVTLALGIVAGLLLQNTLTTHQVTLSGPGLISFVFTVALGAASVILAIITMVLSSHADAALTRRSDEGIRLQTDAFVRTNEVLSKIQASTGVTEKRIEDIISGRTNIIAQEVVEKSLRGSRDVMGEPVEKLKDELAASLKSELRSLLVSEPGAAQLRLELMQKRQQTAAEINREWKIFRTAVVTALRQQAGFRLVSEAEGNLGADELEKFWDAVFDVRGTRVGFDIHTFRQCAEAEGAYHGTFTEPGPMRHYCRQIIGHAIVDGLAAVAFVFERPTIEKTIAQQLPAICGEPGAQLKVRLFEGSPEEIAQAVRDSKWDSVEAVVKSAPQAA